MGIFDNIKTLTGVKKEESVATSQASPITPSKKILIVEDDQYLRDFYVELLTKEGYTVIQAENGQVGYDTVLSQKPDLVLLDLMMPVMDGKTMLHKLRELPEFKSLPVIVLTNAGDMDSMTQTKKYDNANDFIIKSNVNPQDIVNKVKTYTSF